MCFSFRVISFTPWIIFILLFKDSIGFFFGVLPLWGCMLRSNLVCPDPSIKFYLYTPNSIFRKTIEVRSPSSLRYSSWDPSRRNVLIIHGFNGTESKTPMTAIRDAFLSRGDHNVFTVDWQPLSQFPCYLPALANTKLVGQCTAQLYAHIINSGGSERGTTCVGHSLGAHICGMMANHLTVRPHKIIGLDPARPLVDQFKSRSFRLTRDDADVVQVIHTNAGFLGEEAPVGSTDFCVNGGRIQPRCKGHPLRRARCSHFLSACYLAAAVSSKRRIMGVPCPKGCPVSDRGHWPSALIAPPSVAPQLPNNGFAPLWLKMGVDAPENVTGTYCLRFDMKRECPFN